MTAPTIDHPHRSAHPTWPAGDYTQIPFWLYTDPELFEREMARIFCGRSWSYVALEAELPEPGSYKTTRVGDRKSVV